MKLGESSITRTIALIHYYTTAYTTKVKGETIFAKRIKLRIAINTPICICELSYVYSRIVLGVWTYTPTCPVVYDHTSGHVNQSYFIPKKQIIVFSFGVKRFLDYLCSAKPDLSPLRGMVDDWVSTTLWKSVTRCFVDWQSEITTKRCVSKTMRSLMSREC